MRGKGHEASDLNKIMGVYKKWHMDFAPKYHFDYFKDRMTKMSTDKMVKLHMSKLRDVYKEEADHTVEFAGEQVNLKDFWKQASMMHGGPLVVGGNHHQD